MNLHTVAFLIVTALSVLHSVCIDKMLFLSVMFEKRKFSTLALSGLWTLGKLAAIYTLGCKHEKIERMLESMKTYKRTYPNLRFRLGASRKLDYLMYFSIGSTLGTVAMEIWSIYDRGMETALLMGSHALSICLFPWTDGNLSEKAFLLKFEYGSKLTGTTAVMGGILVASEIISILHTGLVLGLMMLVAAEMYTYFAELIRDIREFRGNRRTEKVEEWKRNPVKVVEFWRKLSLLTDVFEAANDAFDELFKLLLTISVLCVGVILPMSFLGFPMTCFCICIVHLVFVEVWFLYAGKIAEQNDELVEWIGKCGVNIGSVRVDGEVVDPRVVLEELEKKPIGLGKWRFIIRYTPHYLMLKIFRCVWGAIFGSGNDN